jgi:hypothetical protein
MKTLDIRRPGGATVFAVCTAAILWVAATGAISTPLELPRVMMLAVLFLAIRILFMKNIPSPTGSGAIVMAIGIFINGAIVNFTIFNQEITRSLTVILFILLLFIAGSYIADAGQRKTFRMHFANPVASFAVGTWIAGISVCGIALSQRLPDWRLFVQVLVIGNIGLWFYFVYRAVRNFFQLFGTESGQKVHGVLLLSTVSTQSLVIVWRAAFGESPGYRLVAPWVIVLGLIFYFVSFYLIMRRYIGEGANIDLDKSWFNTNCILHGAMSITGLASAVCGVVSPNLTLLIWLWAIAWFLIVEGVEIARAVKRSRRHGLADGLLIYDPTQWSRNFTFGMLYAFTMNFDLSKSVAASSFLLPLREGVLRHFAWVVFLLLLFEILVFFRDRLFPDLSTTP